MGLLPFSLRWKQRHSTCRFWVLLPADVQSLPSCPRLNSSLRLRMYPLPILGSITHLFSFLYPHLLPLSWSLHFHFNVLSLFCVKKKKKKQQCSLDSASSLSSCLHFFWTQLTFRKNSEVFFFPRCCDLWFLLSFLQSSFSSVILTSGVPFDFFPFFHLPLPSSLVCLLPPNSMYLAINVILSQGRN